MEHLATFNLNRAMELEKEGRYEESLKSYQEGLQILLSIIKGLSSKKIMFLYRRTKDKVKIKHFQIVASNYMEKAEKIKNLVEAQKKLVPQTEQVKQNKLPEIQRTLIKIEDGAVGFGYNSIFGKFLDARITYIHVEDPYIRTFHQCQNLVRLCELVVQKCSSLSNISLLTTSDSEDSSSQVSRLDELKQSLKSHRISLKITFSETLHDRQIILSNGWIIKIGRGLDYFKPSKGKFSLGHCDLELRQCHETTVDIFHSNDLINDM